MRPADLARSTSFRFAALLTVAFITAYLIAGAVAYSILNEEFDERILQTVDINAGALAAEYQSGGLASFIEAVEARARAAEPDDELIWLGDSENNRIAGQQISPPADLTTGDYPGGVFDIAEDDDLYRVAVRDMDGMRLIIGLNYEEADEIGEALIGAFGWATAFIILFAIAAAIFLANRAQGRLGAISQTLDAVSTGAMKTRAPLTGAGDDLDRLSGNINQALDRLEKTVESIRQVSTDIAHDLRTPINRLGIILESAKSDAPVNTPVEDKLEQASLEVQKITRTFDALLRIAQIEAGARKARFKQVNLSVIAANLIEAYDPVVEEQRRSLSLLPLPEDEPMIFGDADLLTQLFANLIENALRHCPEGSKITIQVELDRTNVSMSVADNGRGIPEAERENALKRFYRLEKSRTREGSGLGLSLVKAICELHGAILTLSDNEPGLLVRIAFPRFRFCASTVQQKNRD